MKKIACLLCLLFGLTFLSGLSACADKGGDTVTKVDSDGKVSGVSGGFTYENDNISLTVTENGVIETISSGEKTIFRGDALQAKIRYSTASDMWQAKSFSDKSARSASVSDGGDRLTIAYSDFEGLDVSVETEIVLNGESIYFYNTVENKAEGTVVAVETPHLQGLQEISGGKFYIPDRNGGVVNDALGANNTIDEQSYRYPLIMSAQLYTYGTDEQTVSIRAEDQTMAYKEFQFGGENNVMSVRQYPFAMNGTTAHLAAVVIKCADDSWHSASDDYGNWYHSWAKSPEHSSKLDSFPIIGETKVNWKPLDENSEPESVTSMVSKLSSLKNRGYGGSEIVTWWGGPDNPPVGISEWQDLVYPDYRYPSTIGDKNGLAEFIDRIHSLGDMQVGFYTNCRLGSQNSELLDSSWKVQAANGESLPDYETWWNNTYNIMCPSTAFLDLTFERQKEFAEAGLDFMQLDQIGAAHSFLCFGEDHGHSTPATAWTEGYSEYLEKISGLTKELDTWFWTEGTWEGSSQYVQVSQYGAWGVDNQDVRNSSHFPAFYLYTFKTHKLFGGAWLGGIPVWTVSPGSSDAVILQNNTDFYSNSEYHDDYGLTYDESVGAAVWHKNGDRVMLLAKGNDANASASFEVKISKDVLGNKVLSKQTAQGDLQNVTVTETDDAIVMTLTLNGTDIGGVLLELK